MAPLGFIIAHFQKSPFFPLLNLRKKRVYLETQLKESLLIYFENFHGAPCSHRQSRKRMINTFIIVNITPTRKKIVWWINLCLLSTSKRLPSHFTWALLLKKNLLITVSFWKLPVYSLIPTGKVCRQKMVNTLLMIKINPTWKRLLIFICQKKTETWLVSPISKW